MTENDRIIGTKLGIMFVMLKGLLSEHEHLLLDKIHMLRFHFKYMSANHLYEYSYTISEEHLLYANLELLEDEIVYIFETWRNGLRENGIEV